MSTTTAAAIRDRMIAVISALVPSSLSSDAFIEYPNEATGNFRVWANANPGAAWRSFQVRTILDPTAYHAVEVSNTDLEENYGTFVVTVSYPQDSRAGDGGALRRDDVIDQDRKMIEKAIGLDGAANFTPDTGADATYRGHLPTVEAGDTCDFLVIRQTMSFTLAV